MTLSDLFAAVWHQRWVVVLGIVLTAAGGFLAVQDRTVFWTRAEVVFLVPQNEYNPNALRAASESVVIAAGAVAKSVIGPHEVTKYSSPAVTLVGAGVREGWSIGQPDTGGQWSSNFESQVLTVEAVGPSRTFVLAKVDQLEGEIASTLRDLQEAQKVTAPNRISVKASPDLPLVYGVAGSRPRALAMTAILGGSLTLAAVVALESRRLRRPRTATRESTVASTP
jgi:hypothetical protein